MRYSTQKPMSKNLSFGKSCWGKRKNSIPACASTYIDALFVAGYFKPCTELHLLDGMMKMYNVVQHKHLQLQGNREVFCLSVRPSVCLPVCPFVSQGAHCTSYLGSANQSSLISLSRFTSAH